MRVIFIEVLTVQTKDGTVYGMYYVTEDEYVISTFDETAVSSKKIFSGLKVDSLLKQLKNNQQTAGEIISPARFLIPFMQFVYFSQ